MTSSQKTRTNPDNPFAGDSDIDRAAMAGFKAAKQGKRLVPSRYASDDLLRSSWEVGNRRGFSEK
jgi:hypothetical protein